MRVALVILFLAVFSLTCGQDWKRPVGIIGYHVGTIALGAVADGLHDEGHKEWAHALHAAEVGALIGGPFIWKIDRREALPYISSYVFLRFSFFDGFYNGTRGLPVLYNGSTSAYDKFMSQMPEHGRAWWKSCSLVVGVSIPLNYLYGYNK